MASVGIIGVGNIGGTLAHLLLQETSVSLFLYDKSQGIAEGKRLDLLHGAAVCRRSVAPIRVATRISEMVSCDFLVVTAGSPRKPGMDRRDLLRVNRSIVESIAKEVQGTEAIVIVVTNPVDLLSFWFYQQTKAHRSRVLGMAGVLDSGRFRSLVAQSLSLSSASVEGLVIGPHNDGMIPLLSSLRVGGVPLSTQQQEALPDIVAKTRKGGAEIVQLLQTGSAFYGPAESIYTMIRSMLYDERRVLPCSVYLDGEYGVRGIFCGVPVVLGSQGVESIFQLPLSREEQIQWDSGIASIQSELQHACPNGNGIA